jgi:hypothetical protein
MILMEVLYKLLSSLNIPEIRDYRDIFNLNATLQA